MLRLTKSVCFALEMARVCLQNPKHKDYTRLGLNKIWDDVTNVKVEGRIVTFRLHVRDFRRVVYVKCILAMGREGQADHGECHIDVKGSESVSDIFFCFENRGEIRRVNGWGLKYLDLDADILETLQAADILTFTELQELTELQICMIFQPTNDPGIWAHPNPAEYIDQVTFDRFDRLNAKLEEKNLHLAGHRLSRQELQSML